MFFSKGGAEWIVAFLGNPGIKYNGTRHNAGFMSGDAIVQAANFYKVPPERVIVVSDETALPIGRLRIRRGGSAGGHNGLKSVIARLGTDQFPRIRLGVGDKPHPDYDMADWVLSAFKGQDAADMELVAKKAADAVECYITEGADRAMNKFN